MSIKLNEAAFEQAKRIIKTGFEFDKQCNWAEHKATADEVDKYLETHNMNEYGQWFLGVDTSVPEGSTERFVLPYGDMRIVHKGALEEAIQKAKKHNNEKIEKAARELLDMIEAQA